ncbi:MAG: 5-formyltetrahydrofolate cyclo-ligase [Rhizobium sp.]|nr:5-formyltetrahydrofolate cyclo-ligase [Rhizobium sp.]
MMTGQEDGPAQECSSPPCSAGDVDPLSMGLNNGGTAVQTIADWRKRERQRLIAARLALPPEERASHAAAITISLDEVIGDVAGKTISTYWPFRGEPDLRPWMQRVSDRGGVCLLPVVVQKAQPLIFRSWKMGEPLGRGVWNIPIPEHGREMTPDIVIAPLVGYDDGCFRLGYGGGFFDRTLASIAKPAMVIGVGYSTQELATIRPQPHDIPMDVIVTEQAVRYR